MKKVFVTGATGFVGSHLVELLTKNGLEVYSLVRNLDKAKEFNIQGTFIKGSLGPNSRLEWISQLPSDLDTIIHTAGIVHAQDTKIFDDINTLASNNLLDKLKIKYQDLNFIFISSLAAGGPSFEIDRNETMPNAPVSHYGVSKVNAEKYIEDNLPESWSYSCIRPPMVIGPRDPAVLDIFKMVKGSVVVGPGLNFKTKEYSFICVYDLVRAIMKIAKQKLPGTFYISHDQKITFLELVNEIKKQLKKNTVIFLAVPTPILKLVANISSMLPIPSRLTKDKVKELVQDRWLCSNEKLITTADYRPKWSLERTIEVTLKDYRERNWI